MADPLACLVPLAVGVKKAIHIPVITAGRISPEAGERILEEGKADFISIGRALIADPELPNKVASGRFADIRPCIACNVCGDVGLGMRKAIFCQVNVAVGKEREYEIKTTKRVKKVLVLGGGPAGMEAARIARLRSHEVALYERENRLGGQMFLAAKPPFKEAIHPFLDYLQGQIEKLGVRIELGKQITARMMAEMEPEAVIVATGGIPVIPEIPGMDKGIKGGSIRLAVEVLREEPKIGKRVVIIGGELVGCEVAEYLADRKKNVTVVRRGRAMAEKVPISQRVRLLNRLKNKRVRMLTGITYERVIDEGLLVSREGKQELLEADTIVLAAGSLPNEELYWELKERLNEVYLVGDAAGPGRIAEAVADGARVGREI